MPRTITAKRENTISLPANDLLTVETGSIGGGEFTLINYGPGNLWFSRTRGMTAAVGSEEVTLLKAQTAYQSARVQGYDPALSSITMVSDSPATVSFTFGT
jgi:hypothetical protein